MGMVDIIASDSDDRKVFFLQKKKKKFNGVAGELPQTIKPAIWGNVYKKTCFRYISAISQKSIPITPQSQH